MSKLTRKSIIKDAKRVARENPDVAFTRALYLKHGSYGRLAVENVLSFSQLKIEAGLTTTASQRNMGRLRTASSKRYTSKELYKNTIGKLKTKHTVSSRGGDVFQAAVASDLHGHHLDLFMRDIYLETCIRRKPEFSITVGDAYNFGGISVHDDRWEEEDLVREIEFMNREWWGPLEQECPNMKKVLTAGNHCQRPFLHIQRESNQFLSLLANAGISQSDLLGLDKYNVEFVTKLDFVPETAAQENGSAKTNMYNLFDKLVIFRHYPPVKGKPPGTHSFHGHTHHPVKWTTASEIGKYDHVTMGCMCKTNQEYVKSMDSSVQGFGWAYMRPNERKAYLEAITISDGFCVLDGVAYGRR